MKKVVEDKKTFTGWSKLIAKPNLFEYTSQEEEINAFRVWSWVFEKYLSSVDEAYIRASRRFATSQMTASIWTWQKQKRNQAVWIASVKAVEDSNGFDAWRSLNRPLNPTSKPDN